MTSLMPHSRPTLSVPIAALARHLRACVALAAVLALLAAGASSAAAQQRAVGSPLWAWSGAVTSSSAVVKARLALPSAGARLRLADDAAPDAGPRLVPADGLLAPDADGVVEFRVQNLRPATLYRYTVESAQGAALAGTFRTFTDGPLSFKVAFASCASTGSNHPVFDAMRGLSPDLFIHMGDFHYENIGRNAPERFHRAYDKVLASPRQSAFYRSTPLVYIWDDHDFGANNADGTSPSKPAAFSVYRQVVPHYPLGTPDHLSVNQAFTIGRVRFIATDSRSARMPSRAGDAGSRTMLGAAQLAWLERELREAADAPLVVWVNTVPWITRRKGSADGWEGYAHERTRLADLIQALGLSRRLVMLSGDAHMVAIDDGTNSNYATGAAAGEPAFPVVHAAPMDRKTSEKGGPYSHGISRQRGQFGFMDLADDGLSLRVELTGRNATGGLIPGMRLVVACEEGVCRVAESDARK